AWDHRRERLGQRRRGGSRGRRGGRGRGRGRRFGLVEGVDVGVVGLTRVEGAHPCALVGEGGAVAEVGLLPVGGLVAPTGTAPERGPGQFLLVAGGPGITQDGGHLAGARLGPVRQLDTSGGGDERR